MSLWLIDHASENHAMRIDCDRAGCDLEALWVSGSEYLCDHHATPILEAIERAPEPRERV